MVDIDTKTVKGFAQCNTFLAVLISVAAGALVFAVVGYGLPMMGMNKGGKGSKIAGGLVALIGCGTVGYFKFVADPDPAGATCPQ